MAFKKMCYTISNSHPKLVVKINFSSSAAQNSRTFQVLSRTYPVFKHFQGPWNSETEFMHFQEFFKHCVNPVQCFDTVDLVI